MRIAQSPSHASPETMDVVKTTGKKRPPTGWGEFGARVKALREARGLSRETIAQSTSIDAVSLFRIEKGDQWISPKALRELAKVLRVEVPAFFQTGEVMPSPSSAEPLKRLLFALASLDDDQVPDAIAAIERIGAESSGARGHLPDDPPQKSDVRAKSLGKLK